MKFKYLRSLVKSGTGDSSKSFALVLSALVGALIGLSICFCLLLDVVLDGVIDTDTEKLGFFLMSDSIFIFGSGAAKVLSEKFETPKKEEETKKKKYGYEEENDEESNNYFPYGRSKD